MNDPVYLDYHATTPCDPVVLETMLPWFNSRYGNASSKQYLMGWQSAEAVKIAREQVASLIHAEPGEVIFTSGATESINTAIKGVAASYASKGRHLITVKTEHSAVLNTCSRLEKEGFALTLLNVDGEGRISLDELEKSIREDTILVSVMYANNETGVLQPVQAISEICRRKKVVFFTDATQAVGKIPLNVQTDGIDLMAFSAHKFYGPKGTGGLYIRRKNPRIVIKPLLDGGGQEKGLRSGTLNVPGIVGIGKAAEICQSRLDEEYIKLSGLRDQLETNLLRFEHVLVNGNREHRLPSVTNLSFRYLDGRAFFSKLNKHLAVSSGSACSAESLEPSPVLLAMGLGKQLAWSSVRFSVGRFTTASEIEQAIAAVKSCIQEFHSTPGYRFNMENVYPPGEGWEHPSRMD